MNPNHTNTTEETITSTLGPVTVLNPPPARSSSSKGSYSTPSYIYILIVGFPLAFVLYILYCTLLFFKVKYWTGKYNVVSNYRMTNSCDPDSSEDSVSVSSMPCLPCFCTNLWKYGTCRCCKCITNICRKVANDTENFQRAKYY
jgi:hypothetical protein